MPGDDGVGERPEAGAAPASGPEGGCGPADERAEEMPYQARLPGRSDTIAAIATPAGVGGVGVVRLSGAAAAAIVAGLLGREPDTLRDRTLVYGVARDAAGERLDDVLAVVMRAPRSFTGEDVAEVHGHGGAVNMGRLLRAVVAAGARHAEPGEFSRRAFEHGKIDLTRAEALADVIAAGSERAWRLAQAQLGGELGRRVEGLRARATDALAEVEACIDFPEEDLTFLGDAGMAARLRALTVDLEALAATFSLGRALREGVDVALLGPVNSGKSSLFNALIGSERTIVSPEPGTTRDYVEARVTWDGLAVTLIDTAGDRDATGDIERRGIELGRRRAAAADLAIVVHELDGSPPSERPADEGPTAQVSAAEGQAGPSDAGHWPPAIRELHVLSKGDLLPPGAPRPDLLVTSALTREGLAELQRWVVEAATGGQAETDDGLLVTSERQRDLLARAAAATTSAADLLDARAPLEVTAIELREAAALLAEITGDRVGDEVLDALFSRFCIGK